MLKKNLLLRTYFFWQKWTWACLWERGFLPLLCRVLTATSRPNEGSHRRGNRPAGLARHPGRVRLLAEPKRIPRSGRSCPEGGGVAGRRRAGRLRAARPKQASVLPRGEGDGGAPSRAGSPRDPERRRRACGRAQQLCQVHRVVPITCPAGACCRPSPLPWLLSTAFRLTVPSLRTPARQGKDGILTEVVAFVGTSYPGADSCHHPWN